MQRDWPDPMAPRARPILLLAATLLAGTAPTHAREVLENTPYPCKKQYSSDFIASAAKRYIEGVPVDQKQPRMLLLLGGSGAGKGTFLKQMVKHDFPIKDYVMHGIDDYLDLLPEWQQTAADPSNIYKDAADLCYGGGAIPIAKAAQQMILDNRMNAIYEETGKNLDRVLKRVVPPFVEKGYAITVALVDNTPEIAKLRAVDRFQNEGRYSSPDYVESTFMDVFGNYLKLKEHKFVTEAFYCDNSCSLEKNALSKPGECLRCWIDGAIPDDPNVVSIVPTGVLLEGPPDYMSEDTSERHKKGDEL